MPSNAEQLQAVRQLPAMQLALALLLAPLGWGLLMVEAELELA